MKLLVIVDSYPPHHGGGYELRCKDVATGLSMSGHQVFIITTRCPEKKCSLHPSEKGIFRLLHKKSQASSTSNQILHDLSDMRFVDKITKSFRPDLVYLWHLGDLSNAILPYFSSRKIPMVYDEGAMGLTNAVRILKRGPYFYDNEKDSSIKKWGKQVITSLVETVSGHRIQAETPWPAEMKILFNSQYSLQYAHEKGVPIENASVIYSGIELKKFNFKPRERLNTPINILVPGRITPQKGTMDALLLFVQLREANISARLTIVGKIYSNAYFAEIQEIIRKLDVLDYISLLPMVTHEELVKLYHANDICFFPSYQKYGLARVPLEAMACGCLVITYGNEASNEIIVNDETGYVIGEGDISAAVGRIQSLMVDPHRVSSVTQTARELIQQKFTMERYICAVEDYLRQSAQNATRQP